MIEPLAKR